MRVGVLETSGLVSGHQRGWLHVVLESLSELGADVCLLSPNPGDWLGDLPKHTVAHKGVPPHREMAYYTWRGCLKPLPSSVVLQRYMSRLSTLGVLDSRSISHFIFNHWDVFHSQLPFVNKILLSRIKVPWSAFWLWPDPTQPGTSLATRNLSNLFYLTEQDRDWLNSLTKGRAVWLPDFAADVSIADQSTLVDQLKGVARGRKVITLAGALSRRKGVGHFLRLAEQSLSSGLDLVFALVGDVRWHEFTPAEVAHLRELSQEPPENMFLYLQTVEDESDLNALLSASSVLYLLYEQYRFSSNFLAKAAAFQVPVLVQGDGALSTRTEEYALGAVIAEGESDIEILKVVTHLSDSGRLSAESCERYLDLHCRSRFKDILKSALAKAL